MIGRPTCGSGYSRPIIAELESFLLGHGPLSGAPFHRQRSQMGDVIVRSSWLTAVTADATPEELPVLARTRQGLPAILADSLAPRRKLAAEIMGDPALALRVLQRANAVPHRHFRAEVVSLEDAAHMLGTQTLQRIESEASEAEQILDRARLALYGKSAGRAVLAALLALDWAQVDCDRFPSEVGLAALLNNLGELFLLAHGDARINRYMAMVESVGVFPHEVEYVTLGESLEDLGHLLAVRWRLPEMVREAMRARNAQHLRTLCVMLATQTARYAFVSWRHPMLATDLKLAAEMLDLELAALVDRVNGVVEAFNGIALNYGLAKLTRLSLPTEEESPPSPESQPGFFCLAPRRDEFLTAMRELQDPALSDRDQVFRTLLRGLHRGLGLNRVVFAAYSPKSGRFAAEHLVGTDFEPAFNRFSLPVSEGGLFSMALEKPIALWLNAGNQAELLPQLPASVRELIGVRHFFVMSVWVKNEPLGLVYADRRNDCCQLDLPSFREFCRLIREAGQTLARLAS